MKRFYVAAAIAASLLATGCQKTYVIDEVRTPIGFSTEVGKQTKAIVDNSQTYLDNQPFGVFAYGVVGTPGENTVTDGKWNSSFAITDKNTVMDNVKITKQAGVWKAASGAYYWPNDSHTTLSFFAYSPYSIKADSSADPAVTAEGMGVTPTFSAANGIQLTDYTHVNYQGTKAVDFMVAETLDQKYNANSTTNGEVSIKFAHRMSQIIFKVAKAAGLGDDITMKLQSLEMLSINNKADYKDKVTSSENPGSEWTCKTGTANYPVFQYSSTEPQVPEMDIDEAGCELDAVTMIPQTIVGGENPPQQQVKIVYTISGTGLANETVTKTFNLYTDGLQKWDANQKITYKITIGMNQITFNPLVSTWTTPESSAEVPIN